MPKRYRDEDILHSSNCYVFFRNTWLPEWAYSDRRYGFSQWSLSKWRLCDNNLQWRLPSQWAKQFWMYGWALDSFWTVVHSYIGPYVWNDLGLYLKMLKYSTKMFCCLQNALLISYRTFKIAGNCCSWPSYLKNKLCPSQVFAKK